MEEVEYRETCLINIDQFENKEIDFRLKVEVKIGEGVNEAFNRCKEIVSKQCRIREREIRKKYGC